MAESTRAMRRSIYQRDILTTFRNRILTEITPDDLRMICGKVKNRSAPAMAMHVRDIVKLIFAFAILHGEKVANPADEVAPASIATFVPEDRLLSPAEKAEAALQALKRKLPPGAFSELVAVVPQLPTWLARSLGKAAHG